MAKYRQAPRTKIDISFKYNEANTQFEMKIFMAQFIELNF